MGAMKKYGKEQSGAKGIYKNKYSKAGNPFLQTLVKWTSACPVFCLVDFIHDKKNMTSHSFILISTLQK